MSAFGHFLPSGQNDHHKPFVEGTFPVFTHCLGVLGNLTFIFAKFHFSPQMTYFGIGALPPQYEAKVNIAALVNALFVFCIFVMQV